MGTFSKSAAASLTVLSYQQITLVGAGLSVLLAFAVFFTVWRQEHAYVEARFYLEAEGTAGAVQQVLDYSTHDFAAARSLFLASSEVTRSEFETFITDQLTTNPLPGLLVIEWVPYVTAEQRTQFEQAAQADGFPNYYFTQRDQEGRFVRATMRDVYYPVHYVAPTGGWNYILGFDIGSDSTRLAALQQARDTGRAAVITASLLVPPAYDLNGSLIFLPIYEPGVPLTTIAERRSHLRGFLLGIFDLQALLTASQDAQSSQAQTLYLLDPDLPPEQQVVFASNVDAPATDASAHSRWPRTTLDQLHTGISQTHEVQVADERWQLLIKPARPMNTLLYPLPLVTGLATFAFSILATAYLARRRQAEEILQRSEEQYRLVVGNVSDVIWAVDIDAMKVQFITPSVSALTGISADEVLCLALPNLLDPDSMNLVQAALPGRVDAARKGLYGPYVDEFALHRKDGSKVWTEATSHIVVNPKTSHLQMYGVSRDITERRRTARIQAAQFAVSRILAQSPKLHDAIGQVLEALAVGLNWPAAAFWQRRADGSHLDWCTGWWAADSQDVDRVMAASRALTFMPGQGLIGRTWLENQVLWEETANDGPDAGGQAMMGQSAGLRSTVTVPVCIDDDRLGVMAFYDRSAHPLDSSLVQTLADLGRHLGQFIARKQAELELQNERALLAQRVRERTADLRQANDELAHALRAKDEFLASMSHELRTPLHGILTLTESLQEGTYGPLNERQSNSLNLVDQSSHHLLALINDVLDMAKVEAGKLDLQIEHISPLAISQASFALVQEVANKKSIRLSLECDKQKDFALSADPRRLKQVLVNLLGNAIKFTSPGGHVTLSVAQKSGAIEFAVQDDGIGIPAALQSKLFQPFTQLDASLARQYEGTGLGLALVRRLVELHNGQVWVESSGVEGEGSRFVVSIPWEEPLPDLDNPPDERSQPSDSAPEIGSAPGPAARHGGAKILVVDDNELNLLALEDFLTNAGYQLVFAGDGEDALRLANEFSPDLILMDIQMPHMSGVEAIRLLRSDPRFATTPVLALTALAMPGDREMCLETGASAYITKPFRLKDLVKIIEEWLSPASEPPVTWSEPG